MINSKDMPGENLLRDVRILALYSAPVLLPIAGMFAYGPFVDKAYFEKWDKANKAMQRQNLEAVPATPNHPCAGGVLEQGKDGQYTLRLPVKAAAPAPR